MPKANFGVTLRVAKLDHLQGNLESCRFAELEQTPTLQQLRASVHSQRCYHEGWDDELDLLDYLCQRQHQLRGSQFGR